MFDDVDPSEYGGTPRLQFSVGALLGFVWLVSCILAGVTLGVAATIAFAIPLGILGFRVLATGIFDRSAIVRGRVPLIVCVTLGILTVLIGLPANLATWLAVFGGGVWILALMVLFRDSKKILLVPVVLQSLLFLYCIGPQAFEGMTFLSLGAEYHDLHTGRREMRVLGMRFRASENNAELIERYLGRRDPHWRHSYYYDPHIRDGDDRLNAGSVIYDRDLSGLLEMLPDESARRQFLKCISDPNNKMRFHQALLVVALRALDYPSGLNSQTWWDHHSHLFRPEDDDGRATVAVWGWCDRFFYITGPYVVSVEDGADRNDQIEILCRRTSTAQRQERWLDGRGELYNKVRESPNKAKDFPELGIHSVSWWPQVVPDKPFDVGSATQQ